MGIFTHCHTVILPQHGAVLNHGAVTTILCCAHRTQLDFAARSPYHCTISGEQATMVTYLPITCRPTWSLSHRSAPYGNVACCHWVMCKCALYIPKTYCRSCDFFEAVGENVAESIFSFSIYISMMTAKLSECYQEHISLFSIVKTESA